MEALYSTVAHATGGGRDGHVRTDDDRLDFDTRPPKELGGSGEGTNPEQLFAAGYSACFLGAFIAAAKQLGTDSTDAAVSTEVSLGKREPTGFQIAVEHDVYAPKMSHEDAERTARVAHEEICPYSHATRGNIEVTIDIVD